MMVMMMMMMMMMMRERICAVLERTNSKEISLPSRSTKEALIGAFKKNVASVFAYLNPKLYVRQGVLSLTLSPQSVKASSFCHEKTSALETHKHALAFD
tara:strand:+ start:249 stop:545 length:297 start_codon:yes stop_codon:yes gene_type:complete